MCFFCPNFVCYTRTGTGGSHRGAGDRKWWSKLSYYTSRRVGCPSVSAAWVCHHPPDICILMDILWLLIINYSQQVCSWPLVKQGSDYLVWNDLYSVGSVKTQIKVIKLFVLLDPSDQCQKISHGKSSLQATRPSDSDSGQLQGWLNKIVFVLMCCGC